MKTEVGQVVGYKSKGNVYDVPAGTYVKAKIENLVTRPGSNIPLRGNPVNLRVFPPPSVEDPDNVLREDFVITHVLEGDGLGEWTADFDEDQGDHEVADDGRPADRVEQIVWKLKQHGIHVDPMAVPTIPLEKDPDWIEGSPREVYEQAAEQRARVSAEKDQKIQGLLNTVDDLTRANAELADKVIEAQKDAEDLKIAKADLQTKVDALTLQNSELAKQRDELQDKLANQPQQG